MPCERSDIRKAAGSFLIAYCFADYNNITGFFALKGTKRGHNVDKAWTKRGQEEKLNCSSIAIGTKIAPFPILGRKWG